MPKAKCAIDFALALMMAWEAGGVASAVVPSNSSQLREAETYGGLFPCYHQACDSLDPPETGRTWTNPTMVPSLAQST